MSGRRAQCIRMAFCLAIGLGLSGCRGPRLQTSPTEGALADVSAPWAGAVPLSRRSVRTHGEPTLPAATADAFLRTSVSRGGRGVGVAPRRAPAAPAGAVEKNLLVLPMEFEADNGAANGNANLVRLLPAYEWPRRANWRIQHMDLITLADAPGGLTGIPGNPEPIAGPRTLGLTDITHVSFFVPTPSGSLIWGAGAALGIPTATDDVLGSGKWSAGPALRLTYRKGPWNLGVLGAQRWSFAGDSNRADTDQLMLRGTFRRQLGEHWFLVSGPIITANWNASSGNRWLVPLGGGLGRKFDFAGRPWAASIQAYANVVRPTGAPTWSIRLTLTAFIPLDS